MNKKLNFFFKIKKNYKIIFHFLAFIVVIFSVYFLIPNFFNYTPELIQDKLKNNNNIYIKNISNIKYKFFPSPRLSLSGGNLKFEDDVLEVEDVEVEIILNPLSIINYKILDYNKLLIIGGSTNIQVNKANQLLNYVIKNRKKINFKKNSINLFGKNKKLFEINESSIKFYNNNNTNKLNLEGFFLDYKIFFNLENNFNNIVKIILKIPELDLSTNILLEKIENLKATKGRVNFKILNNFFQFNLIKEKNFKINKGLTRSDLLNSSFKGDLSFNPYFLFNIDIEASVIDIEKLIDVFQYFLLSEELNRVDILKKIDGSLNFKKKFDGKIVFKNREIFFQDFKVGKKKLIMFDAKISKFEKNSKIKFNVTTDIQSKNNTIKNIKILGHINISSSKIKFNKITFDNVIFTKKKIKIYEDRFKSDVIEDSLVNILNEKKINNFFQSF